MGQNLVVPLDGPTLDRLQDLAISERRSVKMQASVLLRQAVGLPGPAPTAGNVDQQHTQTQVQEAAQCAPSK